MAFAVGTVFSSGLLLVLALLGPGMSLDVILGKTAIRAVAI